MRDIEEYYGANAGKIWKVLEKHGNLTENKLIKNTRLCEEDFYAAIGWLARENKIYKSGAWYGLGESNLTNKIGENAGKLWKTLETWNEIDHYYLPKLAGINEKDAYYALGWLAKEGKIKAKKFTPKTPQIKYYLK